LRKKLNEKRDILLAGGYDKILQESRIEFEKMRMDYDKESESGNNLDVQVQWETKINEQLASLSDYCKTCTPK
jgi:hypothetical protein